MTDVRSLLKGWQEHTDEKNVMRCPCCHYISTVKVEDHQNGFGTYFACQNPKCNVERIYASNAVMVGGPK